MLMQVEYLDAKLGRRGHVNVHGSLPMSTQQPQTLAADSANPGSALSIEVVDLETRIRNVYTGELMYCLLSHSSQCQQMPDSRAVQPTISSTAGQSD